MKGTVALCLYSAFVVIFCTTLSTSDDNSHADLSEKFIPTSEWQKVKKGQPLPAGLHYRLNIQTGETEAKLLDPKEPSKGALNSKTDLVALTSEKSNDASDGTPYMSKDELKKILADIPTDDASQNPEESDVLQEENQKATENFRSYEELKKEFGSLNLTVKTDMEILNELVAKAKQFLTHENEGTEEETITVLKDLEYLVHQIDNAREFVRLGGLTHIIVSALNSTSANIRAESLWLLGSAAQSNPKVQIAIINSGILSKLVKVAVLDPDITVLSKAVYALSCLLRQFPTAQSRFIEEGGLASFSGIIDSKRSSDFKTQMKVITLINDLLTEHSLVAKAVEGNKDTSLSNENEAVKKLEQYKRGELKEKLRQYDAINFKKHLVENGWCQRLSHILWKLHESGANSGRAQRRDDLGSVISKDLPYRPEHDAIEKVADTLLALKDFCLPEFQDDIQLQEALDEFLKWYEELSIREEVVKKQTQEVKCEDLSKCSGQSEVDQAIDDGDMYYTGIAEKLKEILKHLQKPNLYKSSRRDEL